MHVAYQFLLISSILYLISAEKPKFPDELKDIIIHVHNTCVDKTGVAEEDISNCENGVFAEDKKLKCYMFCLMEEASFVDDDGSVDYDMLISMIPDSWRDKVGSMIGACRHLDVPGKDGCERAYDVHKCLYANDPEVNPDDKSTVICIECYGISNRFYTFYKQVKRSQKKFIEKSTVLQEEDNKTLKIKSENKTNFQSEAFSTNISQSEIENESVFKNLEIKDETPSYPVSERQNIPHNIEPKIESILDFDNNDSNADSFCNDLGDCNSDDAFANEETDIALFSKAKKKIEVPCNEIDDSLLSDDNDKNIDYKDGYPSEIFQNGKLILKRSSLENLVKKFYNMNCNICKSKQTFSKLTELFKHYESEHKVKGYVSCCNTQLYQRRTIYMHMARHIQPAAFECPICKKSVSRPNTLKLHLQTHLPDSEKPHKCDQCDKRYSCIAGLTSHKLTHVPIEERNTYECKICGKLFTLSTSYAGHMATVHSSVKFLCAECGRSFQTKTNLTLHMMTHDPTGKNKAQCVKCGFICKNNLSLQRHMKRHTTERLHCSLCDFTTPLQQRLNIHIRVKHSNFKPYVCFVCGKRFKIKNVLNTHMAQHTGERKFACNFCPKTFVSSGNYYTHRKRMHADQYTNDVSNKQSETFNNKISSIDALQKTEPNMNVSNKQQLNQINSLA